jgi:periplasmic divalent cation tolerance protein
MTLLGVECASTPERRVFMERSIQITTTADRREVLEEVARHLLEQRLVSCAQIVGPITSMYWWKENIEETEEWLCLLKTRKALFKKVEREITRLHPYEVPEIVALDITHSLPAYGAWLFGETRNARDRE